MLKTTEPVIIMTKAELEAIIYSAVKKAVSEVMDRQGDKREATVAEKMRQRNRPARTVDPIHPEVTTGRMPLDPNGDRLLRMKQVEDKVGMKKTVIYEWVKAGTFPKPIKLGSASVWQESEVQDWINQKTG